MDEKLKQAFEAQKAMVEFLKKIEEGPIAKGSGKALLRMIRYATVCGAREFDCAHVLNMIPCGKWSPSIDGGPCVPFGPDVFAILDLGYKIELVERGITDYDKIRFTDRYDGRSVIVTIKTAPYHFDSPEFLDLFNQEKAKLKKRLEKK